MKIRRSKRFFFRFSVALLVRLNATLCLYQQYVYHSTRASPMRRMTPLPTTGNDPTGSSGFRKGRDRCVRKRKCACRISIDAESPSESNETIPDIRKCFLRSKLRFHTLVWCPGEFCARGSTTLALKNNNIEMKIQFTKNLAPPSANYVPTIHGDESTL